MLKYALSTILKYAYYFCFFNILLYVPPVQDEGRALWPGILGKRNGQSNQVRNTAQKIHGVHDIDMMILT